MTLTDLIKPRQPLPELDGWTATEELLETLNFLIKKFKPKNVVEFGSGISTLVAGYTLKSSNKGRIYSLEHDEDFYRKNRDLVNKHGLSRYANIIYAPLIPYDIDGKSWLSYDLTQLRPQSIDLLFIDGPPKATQPLARFPALPLLSDRLSPNAIVVLDDYKRPDEQEVVKRWMEMFPNLKLEVINHERGTAILRSSSS